MRPFSNAALVLAGLLSSVTPAAADQGMTSPTHSKFVGKVVFSTQEIDFKKENAKAFATSFKASDAIYGRLYLAKSLHNTPLFLVQTGDKALSKANNYQVQVYVDGKKQVHRFGAFDDGVLKDKAAREWTTWRLDLNASKSYRFYDKRLATRWAKTVNPLAPGKHTIRVEIWAGDNATRSKKPVAVGSFTLIKTKGDALGGGGVFPKEVYKGGDKSKLKKAVVKSLLARRVAKSPNAIKKVALVSQFVEGRYTDTRNRYRSISATILFADTNNDKMCRFVTYNFLSDKRGKGWAPLRFGSFCNGRGCYEGDVLCK